MKKFYVYFHINPITKDVFYVGKGRNDRAYINGRNNFWNNTVNKYGKPIVLIVKENISEKYAFILEKAYIKILGRRDLNEGTLVNLTNGGEGISGYKHTNESKEKISETHIGNKNALGYKHTKEAKQKISETHIDNKYTLGYKHTEETKKKMSNKHKGKNNSFYGKKHTEETKKKISKTVKSNNYAFSKEQLQKMSETHIGNTYCLGNKLTDEHKKKISKSNKGNTYCLGNKLTDEHKKNISKGNKGKNKGRIFSKETLKKMSESAKKRIGKLKWIYNLDLEENKIVNIKDIDDWIEKGWIKGRKRKFDKKNKL